MFKTLMKKQLMEMFRSYFVNRKTGKANPPGKIIRTFAVFAFALCLLGYFFSGLCSSLADGLIAEKYDGLYFSVCGILSAFIGIFGSVFSSYSMIYKAKDNDLLFSLPIPSGIILASKITGTLFLSFIYESTVFVPSIIQYNIHKPGFSVSALFCQIASLLLIALFVTAFTCIFGFFIAVITSRMRNKNITVIVFSVAFFVAYYVFYFKINSYIQMIVTNAGSIDKKIKSVFYIFWAMGNGSSGKIKYLLIFAAVTVAVFCVVISVMSKTYISVSTSSRGIKKKEYSDELIKEKSSGSALLGKEIRHLLGTPVYLLNSGIGILLIPAAAIAMLIFRSRASLIILQLGEFRGLIIPACGALACLVNCIGNFTAPSVSLEGKNLWILKSIPVETKDILLSKLRFHVRMSIIEAEIFALAVSFVFNIGIVQAIFVMLIAASFVAFTGLLGLAMNLKNTNLEWTNPTIPVKQDMPVIISLLVSFVSALLPGLCGFIILFTGADMIISLVISLIIYAVLDFVMYRWVMTKGVSLFEEL